MNAISARPVRICVVMKDGSLLRSIKQVLRVVGEPTTHVFVESTAEADLVIFSNMRDIEREYSKEKSYAYLPTPGESSPQLPHNCKILSFSSTLLGLTEAIKSVREKLAPITEAAPAEPEVTVPLRPDALWILVIDDKPENIASAKWGLAGHHLTTVTGYEDAMEILGKEKFEIVLTDLHLPMSSQTMGDKFRLGELVPYGLLLMVEAAHQGAKQVAVVTDLSHHDDPFSAAFDHFSGYPVEIDGVKVRMMHAPMKNGAKDWAAALDRLLKD